MNGHQLKWTPLEEEIARRLLVAIQINDKKQQDLFIPGLLKELVSYRSRIQGIVLLELRSKFVDFIDDMDRPQ